MNFVADEGLDRHIVERLRRDGHLVSYVAEMDAGISDESVLELANRQNAMVASAIAKHGTELSQAFTVISRKLVRIRPRQL